MFARPGALTRPGGPSASYMRGEASPFFFNWRPALRDASDDVRSGYVAAASRAIDTMQNSGWIAGAVEQSISTMIGPGLRINAKPDTTLLGWDDVSTSEWARLVERRWEAWASSPYECDLTGRMNLAQLTAAAIRQWFATGEIAASLQWRTRPGALSGTKVLLIPSHRLTQESDDLRRLFQGVFLNTDGLPVGYRFSSKDANGFERTTDLPARDAFGRPSVIHVFDGAASQVRGITPLAPALRVLRQFDQLADATLTAALIQAIFAATVESAAPTEDVLTALQDPGEQGLTPTLDGFFSARAGWYSNTKIDLGTAGKIAHLFPGETLNFNKSETPNATYEAFAKFLLREVARCIGVTFEQLTGDYSGATYSSVRMSGSENWQIVMYRRANIVGRFLQPIYEAWLEEEIEAGRIPFPGGAPGFLALRSAAARCDWRGPAKPQADDLKAAKAHEVWKTLGVMTDEMICAELGQDWEDVYEQRAREKAARELLGIEVDPAAVEADRFEENENENGDD